MTKRLLPLVFLLPLLLNAADDTGDTQATWKGEGELGFTSTSGNTDSENLIASLGASREQGRWKHSVDVASIRAKAGNTVTADSLVLAEKSEYGLDEKSYLFGKLRYEDDKFSGYDYQGSIAFGVGSRFLQSDPHYLDASIGLGYRGLRETVSRVTEEEAIVIADLDYRYKLSESATFSETVLVESGDKNTHTELETSLQARVDGNLATRLSYLVKRNSDVPFGTEKTDRLFTVSLVYAF